MLRETMMAADACPNIHVDTSSSNSWIRYAPGWTLPGVFKTAMSVLGPSRLLFGTDSSFFPRGWQRGVYESQKTAAAEAGHQREAIRRSSSVVTSTGCFLDRDSGTGIGLGIRPLGLGIHSGT